MQRTHHNIYLAPAQTYQAPWAAQLEALFPGTRSVSDLVTTLPPVGKIKDYFTAAFLQDVANNPFDPLQLDLQRNELLAWRPRNRISLCRSSNDASVPFKNVTRAIDTFKRNGSTQLTTLDLGTGKREYASAFVHLAVEESCVVAVRQQLLDRSCRPLPIRASAPCHHSAGSRGMSVLIAYSGSSCASAAFRSRN